jgi:hypothetical protein
MLYMPFVFIYLRNCSSHRQEDKALLQAGISHQIRTISPTVSLRSLDASRPSASHTLRSKGGEERSTRSA